MSEYDEYEEELVECEVCEEDIAVDMYLDIGDTVYCEECGTEFIIKSREPLLLKRMDDEDLDEDDDESWSDD